MWTSVIVILLVAKISLAAVPGVSEQNSNTNGASRDYKMMKTGSDKHHFGVEVEEHRQFHHTTTEEDGVRLGCYGHVHEGKKYATRYVADARGYRVVPYADFITVYPKSGAESRKASFSRDLRPDQIMSEHVKFYFPEGCQKDEVEVKSESRLVSTRVTPPPQRLYDTTSTPDSSVTPDPITNDDQCGPREPPQCECTCTY